MRALLLAALLCGCAQAAPPAANAVDLAEMAELQRIDRACADEYARLGPDWLTCDYGGIEEARVWEACMVREEQSDRCRPFDHWRRARQDRRRAGQ